MLITPLSMSEDNIQKLEVVFIGEGQVNINRKFGNLQIHITSYSIPPHTRGSLQRIYKGLEGGIL